MQHVAHLPKNSRVMQESSRRSFSWNLPAAIGAITVSAWGLFTGAPLPQPDTPALEQIEASQATASALPTHQGLVSFPTGQWQDPFQFRNEARAKFEEQANLDLDSNNEEKQAASSANVTAHYKDVIAGALEAPDSRLLIMPILILGESTAEERRDRELYRRAVEHGLARSGYKLSFPDRMSFAWAKDLVLERGGKPIQFSAAVPIKLYSLEKEKSFVLVMWIDQRLLGDTPLNVLMQIIDKVADIDEVQSDKTGISIVGPKFSEDLSTMAKEAESCDSGHPVHYWATTWRDQKVRIYSPTATDYQLDGDLQQETLEKAQFELIRVIGPNDLLTDSLIQELKLRWLGKSNAVFFIETGSDSPNGIANALVELTDSGQQTCEKVPILKGLGSVRASTVNAVENFDRTLLELRGKDRERINLVGVFSNHIEDKLAILRRVRPMYPNANFITTDMHADFLQRNNLAFTRNLLVASHYGLKPKIASNLSFRDTYQVAVFEAVTLSLNQHDQLETQESLQLDQASVFEIGNFYAARYGYQETDESAQAPVESIRTTKPDSRQLLRNALIVFVVGVLSVLFMALFLPFFQPLVSWSANKQKPSLAELYIVPSRIWIEIGLAFAATCFMAWYMQQYSTMFVVAVFGLLFLVAIRGPFGQSQTLWLRPVLYSLFLFIMLTLAFVELQRPHEDLDWFNGTCIWPSFFLMSGVCIVAGRKFSRFIANRRFPWYITTDKVMDFIQPLIAEDRSIGIAENGGLGSKAEDLIKMCWYQLHLKGDVNNQVWHRQVIRSAVRELNKDAVKTIRWIAISSLLAIFLLSVIFNVPISPPPARGAYSIIVSYFANILATLLLFTMVSLLLLQTVVLRRYISIIRKNIKLRIHPNETSNLEAVERIRKLLDWVEVTSGRSTRGLLLPSALVLVYAIARLPVWDGWHLNLSALTTLLVPMGATIVASLALRQEAHRLRNKATRLLKEAKCVVSVEMTEMQIPDSNQNYKPEELENQIDERKERHKYIQSVIDEIQSADQGVFKNIWHDPILGSCLLFITTLATGPGKEIFGFLVKLSGFGT